MTKRVFTWSSHEMEATGQRNVVGRSVPRSLRRTRPRRSTEARRLAQQHPLSQVVIKSDNGRVEREYTYGEDPHRFRG